MTFIALALTLVFLYLKIEKKVDWAWWVVFLPIIIWAALIALIVVGVLSVVLIAIP